MDEELWTLFEEFQRIPKGVLVDRQNEQVRVFQGLFFMRRTLKHLAEKGREGRRLLQLIPDIFNASELILRGRNYRLLFVRFFPEREGEPHVLVVECVGKVAIVVTCFVTDEKYLKNFEILWRTGTSLL